MNWGRQRIPSKFNRLQFEDGFVKHAQLAVSVGVGEVGAEVHGEVSGQGRGRGGSRLQKFDDLQAVRHVMLMELFSQVDSKNHLL